jgi:hypothetical protein
MGPVGVSVPPPGPSPRAEGKPDHDPADTACVVVPVPDETAPLIATVPPLVLVPDAV